MKKRTFSLILCALLLANLMACGDSGASGDTSASDSVTDAPVETEPPLKVPKTDNGGREFNILTTLHAAYEYDAEEQTGDVVSDAVYERNAAVEELLGIDLNFTIEAGHWVDRESFNGLIKNSVMAGDGTYDLVNGVTVCVLPIAGEGVFIDANELEYVDLNNPWWVQGMNDDLAIGGKLYGFIGDASLSLYKDMSVVFFNKQLLENYKLTSPYEDVRNGTWTLDKFTEMIQAVGSDLNGDGKWDPKEDLFGMIYHDVPMRAFQTSTEFTVIDMDENGDPFIADLSERDTDTFLKLFSLITEPDNVWGKDVSDHNEIASNFAADRALFMCDFLYDTEYLRDMTSDFGIIPYPKRDAEQKDYHTQIGTSTSMFFVPKTTKDVTLTSQVCEALSYYSSVGVIPAYYEVALKGKYTRDEDAKEMLEIIRSSAQMDFTYAYHTMFSPPPNKVTMTAGNNIASYYATNKPKWEGTLSALLESYASLE